MTGRNNIDGHFYIGLMSGTSMDGVDGVLAHIPRNHDTGSITLAAALHIAFEERLRQQLMSLQTVGDNEIEREALAANALVHVYAECVSALLDRADMSSFMVTAIGAHGQTVRHHPEKGYTRQINNPALLAEMTGIDVIADFRARDVAAGGQGAPLVPAFHGALFGSSGKNRAVVNIGGIANISVLDACAIKTGFDTGPGNVLMDSWIGRNRDQPFDEGGKWARSGHISQSLLSRLLQEPYLGRLPPKSTGRDLFNDEWLDRILSSASVFMELPAEDVQATLCAFTAATIADALFLHARTSTEVLLCGGGARNTFLVELLGKMLQERMPEVAVLTVSEYGIDPTHVEALAFAWLAHCFTNRLPGNVPQVTGAPGPRVLGALYPAGTGVEQGLILQGRESP